LKIRKTGRPVPVGPDPEIRWRALAMLRQIPRSGPIPTLVAREGPFDPGDCISCGDPIDGKLESPLTGKVMRCIPCQQAAQLAIKKKRGV
jgi:hypothetical protein